MVNLLGESHRTSTGIHDQSDLSLPIQTRDKLLTTKVEKIVQFSRDSIDVSKSITIAVFERGWIYLFKIVSEVFYQEELWEGASNLIYDNFFPPPSL